MDAQEIEEAENKRIVVLGSSVAAGWVSSYEEQYDFKNGYAYRLERYLAEKGYDVINKSVPGDNTKDALQRFDEDVLPEKPDYLIVGLSMSNEGLETKNPDSVYLSFQTGIKKIIARCEAHDIYPVLGLCYANDNFTAGQYEYLKRMNVEMNSYGYPCINFLGAFDDGFGHLPGSFKFDANHPDNRGHEEFFLSIIPDLFQAIDDAAPVPEIINHSSYIQLGKKEKNHYLYYFPSELVHSFNFGFMYKSKKGGQLAEVRAGNKRINIEMDKKGQLLYNNEIIPGTEDNILNGDWNSINICQQYLAENIEVYLNGFMVYSIKDHIEPAAFIIGSEAGSCQYRNLMIHRAALNPDEISASKDMLIHASLACYAPLQNGGIENHAQTKSLVYLDPKNENELFDVSLNKIKAAAEKRENELVVEDKKAVSMDPEKYLKFAGKYQIAKGDYFVIEVEDDKVYFVDRGRKGEILPESENKFFIKYPGEITFTFVLTNDGKVESMVANFNGHKIPAVKVNE